MVAEPFIFLSSDRQVDVRCCMAGPTPLFCVVDFIRRTANRRMGPLDALQYWMDISLRLQSEHDVMHSFVYRFPGPYERPNVCVSANGLLVLYHHMYESGPYSLLLGMQLGVLCVGYGVRDSFE